MLVIRAYKPPGDGVRLTIRTLKYPPRVVLVICILHATGNIEYNAASQRLRLQQLMVKCCKWSRALSVTSNLWPLHCVDHAVVSGKERDCFSIDSRPPACVRLVTPAWPWPDSMTFTLQFDLDILKMYLHTKNEVSIGRGLRKLEPEQDRQTDRQTDTTRPKILPHRIRV